LNSCIIYYSLVLTDLCITEDNGSQLFRSFTPRLVAKDSIEIFAAQLALSQKQFFGKYNKAK
jgi:hypothetical protein